MFCRWDSPDSWSGTINDRFFTKVRDIATIAGRIGITSDLFDRTLFYVKGGAAYARDDYSVTSQFSASFCIQGTDCSALNGNGLWSSNQNRWGWMAGVGLEFGLFDNWSAKIEYDFLGFGKRDVTLTGSATATCTGPCGRLIFDGDPPSPLSSTFGFSRTFGINENIQLIKLGLNYRFWWGKGKAPVVAKY
jgi:outer membrane immunogenic protein